MFPRYLLFLLPLSLAQEILLPHPPGPHNVTIRTSALTDFGRPEIYAPNPESRRLMISVFSPVERNYESGKACESLYMPPDVAAFITAVYANYPPPDNFTIDFSRFRLRACSKDVTYGLPNVTQDLPSNLTTKHKGTYKHHTATYPLIFFGPGLGTTRLWHNLVCQFLASWGFIVVSTDHPYDALAVQFPDGSYTISSNQTFGTPPDLERNQVVRVKDVRFVLDQLTLNKTLQGLVYPHGVRPKSVAQVGIWGHSFGGSTAAAAMLADSRFKGGINLDGTVFGSAPSEGFDRPFILWQSDNGPDTTDPTWAELYPRLRSFKRHLQMDGSKHLGLTDVKYLADVVGVTSPTLGCIDGMLELETMVEYARDFFGMVLQGKGEGLLGGSSGRFPHVRFL